MDESLINQLINIATDLSKVYNQIVIAESRSDNSKLKKLKNELIFILNYEDCLYRQINYENFDFFLDLFEHKYPHLMLDLSGVLFSELHFSSLHHVYSRLRFMKELQYIYPECSLKEYDCRYSYSYLFNKIIYQSAFILFHYYPRLFIYIKYNLIYSFYDAFITYQDYQQNKNLSFYPSKSRLDYYELGEEKFYKKLTEDLIMSFNSILQSIEVFDREEINSDSFDSFNQQSISFVLRMYCYPLIGSKQLKQIQQRLIESSLTVPNKISVIYNYLLEQLPLDQIMKEKIISRKR